MGADSSFADQLIKWSTGVPSEVDFWTGWIRSKGNEYPQDFERRLCMNDAWAADNVPVPLPTWAILDVGSGPLTRLNKTVGGKPLNITAVDPLAPYYDRLLDSHGVVPPIRTKQGFAEDLTVLFGENTFDMVTCQNALDHSIDPLRAIDEMLAVAKVGGCVVLTHAFNEGQREGYCGLHQWNFDYQNGKFVIWNKQESHVADDIYCAYAHVETYKREGLIRTVLTKLSAPASDMVARHKNRLRDVLSASLDAVYRIRLEIEGGASPGKTKPTGIRRLFSFD